jgi:hypothetical protein
VNSSFSGRDSPVANVPRAEALRLLVQARAVGSVLLIAMLVALGLLAAAGVTAALTVALKLDPTKSFALLKVLAVLAPMIGTGALRGRTGVGSQSVSPRVDGAGALRFVERLVPQWIADEEFGDASEVIAQMIEQQRPRWQVYLKVMTTIFWVFVNAFRVYARRAIAPKTLKKKG